MIKKIIQKFYKKPKQVKSPLDVYIQGNREPWSIGYIDFKKLKITQHINTQSLLTEIDNNNLPDHFGVGIDERIIEYPWVFSKLSNESLIMLDAGSTFNFDYIVDHPLIENKDLTIFTFAPEKKSFNEKSISYVYGDLRELPFKDELYDIIVSQSTIEHIDMDNSIYGYDINHNINETIKSFEFLPAIKEMVRVLKPKGTLLLTFPFGKFENHGFFQQLDEEMVDKIDVLLSENGSCEFTFFRYTEKGWIFCQKNDCHTIMSYNPHTGKGKLNDGAAHCRSICCIEFIKNEG